MRVKSQEQMELIGLKMLGEDDLAEMHEKAMELEKSGYEIMPDVYGQTEPMTLKK